MNEIEKVLICYSGHSSSTFDVSRYLTRGFKKAGYKVRPFRYDTEVTMASAMVRAWRQENGAESQESSGDAFYLATRSLIADIATFQPQLVVIVTGILLFADAWPWMKELQKALRKPFVTGLLLTESPYREEEELNIAPWANIVWTNERAFLPKLRAFHPLSYWMPHAYCDTVHHPGNGGETQHDVYFCGTGKVSRVKMLSDTDWTGINFRLEGVFPDLEQFVPSLLPYYVEGLVHNEAVAEKFRHSAICLNRHRREAERVVLRLQKPGLRQRVETRPYLIRDGDAHCLNDRAFQIAACGNLQLCDTGRQELQEAFGESVPTYNSPEELRDKVLFFLAHETERKRLAALAYDRIRHRTYANNAATMVRQVMEAF